MPLWKIHHRWAHHVDEVIKPWVGDRGYDWGFTITEPPADLWSRQGFVPPPFESHAEKLPVNLSLTPGSAAGVW